MKKAVSILLATAGILMIAIGAIPKIATLVTNVSSAAQAISVIGGADGPTSVFIAGKIGPDFGWISIIAGVILFITGFLLFMKQRRRL